MPYQSRPSLPARSASLPPLHLECPEIAAGVQPASGLFTLPEESDHFPWVRLPKALQHDILQDALAIPDSARHDAVFGGKDHQAHLRETAVPLFLGLGNWDAYLEAAAILYRHVCITRCADRKALLQLISSPDTLRVRSLIYRLDIHVRMPQDLELFDVGLSDTQSSVPFALHSMRVHGRLREMGIFLHLPEWKDYNYDTQDLQVMEFHLPMARLQMASWQPSALLSQEGSQPVVFKSIRPGRAIIAPAFLASRAFQSGFLPLLESNVFEKLDVILKYFSAKGDVRDAETDGHSMFRYWFGATKLGDIPSHTAWRMKKENPNQVDLFPFVPQTEDPPDALRLQVDEDGDKKMVDIPNTETNDSMRHTGDNLCIETVEYRERGDDLLFSPTGCPEVSIDSGISLTSSEVIEDLHSMIARTAAEVTGGYDEQYSQGVNALPCQNENVLDVHRSSSLCDSEALSAQFTSCVEAISSESSALTSDTAVAIQTIFTADNADASTENAMLGHGASLRPEPTQESIPNGGRASQDLGCNVARKTTPEKRQISLNVDNVDAQSTQLVADKSMSKNEGDSNTDTDSDSKGDTNSSKNLAVEHSSQRVEHAAATPSHTPGENHGQSFNHMSDSDSSDESSEEEEEVPPSRSAAFAKKKSSPHKIPIPSREVDNIPDDASGSSEADTNSDTSSDLSSSEEDDDNPKSPTMEVSPSLRKHHPVDDGSLTMAGALPSTNPTSAASSSSDSEGPSDSEDVSSDGEDEVSSETLSQVGKIFGARAGLGVGSASVSTAQVVAAPQSTWAVDARKTAGAPVLLTSGKSDTDSDASSSSSSSDSDDSSSGSSVSDARPDASGPKNDKPCPKPASRTRKPRAAEGDRKAVTALPPEETVSKIKPEARPVSRPARPIAARTSPAQSTGPNKHQTQSAQQKAPRGSSINNSTPVPSRKRKTPPQSTDRTRLLKNQRKRRKRNMARQRKTGRLEAAHQ